MTSTVLCQNGRVVTYLPCFRSAVKQARAFSSFSSQRLSEGRYINGPTVPSEAGLVWPNSSLGPLAGKDRRFPLPGSVGVSPHLRAAPSLSAATPRMSQGPMAMSNPDPHESRASVITEFCIKAEELPAEGDPVVSNTCECIAQDCPKILQKDFQDLFPDRDLMQEPLTIITISLHTRNDMSVWSPEVEEERDELLHTFIKGGEKLCSVLKELGYWADFIDPSSGRPYYGQYTNATLFETDERYRKLGFEINDLGCCKVISHHLWGANAFLGSIFTNCPVSDPVLQSLMHSLK